MFRRFVLCMITAMVCILTASCNDKKTDETKSKTTATGKYDFSQSSLKINRPKRESTKPMGKEGTWTLFVYMCGSDLESKFGAASLDIEEMMNSSVNDNVNFVIETGGSKKWQNGASNKKLQRFVISGGKTEKVSETDSVSMGLDSTLADFLNWGIENYPAANIGLILWNHGGGSVRGVCFDEKFSDDQLLLRELDAALYSVYDKMTEPFEFIGFDACLMSSVETASLMSTHANYMIASEETVPGSGWDYVSIGDFLTENPKATGAELGQVVCDSLYDSCASKGESNAVTMSVVDLSNIDTLLNGFDIFAKDLYDSTKDTEKISAFFRNMYSVDRYGPNDIISGYANMADLGGVINAGSEYSKVSEDLTKALNDCVIYKKNGLAHNSSSGLSIYYPFGINMFSEDEMNIFKDVAISSYYLGIVDKVVYGAINADISGYDNGEILQLFLSEWSNNSYSSSDSHYSYSLSSNSNWSYTQNHSYTGQSNALSFGTEPHLSNGHYSFTISADTIHNTEHVQSSVYYWLNGNTEMFELGETGDVDADLTTGVVSDNFNGKWFALPDGQVLSVYLMETSDDIDLYYSPILLNDVQTNLRFSFNKKKNEAEMVDVFDGISENGIISRNRTLEKGDIIKPVHYIRNKYNETKKHYYGKEFEYTGKDALTFAMLPEGEYWYSFRITDIFGDWLETEPICFNVKAENDRIEFIEEYHKWLPATCTSPKVCAFCGATDGEPAEHKWKDATCTEPKTCEVCGKTEGKTTGHKWKEATFTDPKTCEVCGENEGEPISIPIGSGYVDYTMQDVDNDGEKELIELYEVGFEQSLTYRVYDTQTEYYDYEILGGARGFSDFVVYNGNTGRVEIWKLITGSPAEPGFTMFDVQNNEARIISVYQSYNTESPVGSSYFSPASYYIGSSESSKNEFLNYLSNVSFLYGYYGNTSILSNCKNYQEKQSL